MNREDKALLASKAKINNSQMHLYLCCIDQDLLTSYA